jgi:hypothetical protein
MGFKDLFGKGKNNSSGADTGSDESKYAAIQMVNYECIIGAYYQNRDPDAAWPLSWFEEDDPFETLEQLADMLPDYFELNEDEENRGVFYISPESTGIKVLDKNDLKNELGLIMSVAGKAASNIDSLLRGLGVVSDDEEYIGVELGTQNVSPEAILIPKSNIVLLHCELTLKYGFTDIDKLMASLDN